MQGSGLCLRAVPSHVSGKAGCYEPDVRVSHFANHDLARIWDVRAEARCVELEFWKRVELAEELQHHLVARALVVALRGEAPTLYEAAAGWEQ